MNYGDIMPVKGHNHKDRRSCKLRAYTTKEIKGESIGIIPEGTFFTITHISLLDLGVPWKSSVCEGLPIFLIWNDEFIVADDIKEVTCI